MNSVPDTSHVEIASAKGFDERVKDLSELGDSPRAGQAVVARGSANRVVASAEGAVSGAKRGRSRVYGQSRTLAATTFAHEPGVRAPRL